MELPDGFSVERDDDGGWYFSFPPGYDSSTVGFDYGDRDAVLGMKLWPLDG